ncbi:MFS transporter [Kitasatospora sp. NPDC050543]|uniref:MFS transporter n=1 Tax=Kitasatospora sp. NPDC050543 TaxID=3364054 RepID=UPI00378AAA47
MRRLLADRDTRLYLVGQILSGVGDSALWLALGIWIKTLTGSASAAGLSFFVFALGTLGGPLGGVLADRMRRRPLLITANLATAALVLLLLLVRGPGQLWLIYVVMFGYGLSAAVLGPAQAALLQTLVPQETLGDANSLLQTMQWGTRLFTPLLGAGLLAAFGATPMIIGDVATFLVAAASLLALRIREARPCPPGQGQGRCQGQGNRRRHRLAEAAAGARHIRDTRALRQLTLAGALTVTAFGLSETAVFAVVSDGLHRPDTFLGVLISTQGVGAVLAGVSAAALMRRLGEGRLVALGQAGAAIGFLLQAVPSTPSALAGAALVGAGLPWISVGVMTLYQRRVPPELMGRAQAALGLALSTPQTIAIAFGAALITVLDHRVLLLAIAGLAALASAYLFTRPEQRRAGSALPEPAEASGPAAARDAEAVSPCGR